MIQILLDTQLSLSLLNKQSTLLPRMPLSKRGSFQDHDDMEIALDDLDDDSAGGFSGGSSSGAGGDDGSGSAGSSSGASTKTGTQPEVFAKDEARMATKAKYIFLFMLLVAAAGLGTIVYLELSKEETEDFETQYTNQANEVLEVSNDKVQNALDVLSGVSTTITSFMLHENEMVAWAGQETNPSGFMTIPDVEHHFSVARKTTGALVIAYMPLVESDDLDKWNTYSQQNQYWIGESNNDVHDVEPILPKIWDYLDEDEEEEEDHSSHMNMANTGDGDNDPHGRNRRMNEKCGGGFRRTRRTRNLQMNDINMDMMVETNNGMNTTVEEGMEGMNDMGEEGMDMGGHHGHHGGGGPMVEYVQSEDDIRVPLTADQGPFAPVWTLSPPPHPEDTEIINYNLFARPVFEKAVKFIEKTKRPTFLDVCNQAAWFGNDDHADELQTVIAYPVFSNFETDAAIVGHLTAIIPWRVFFEDILAQGTDPIEVVLENTCDEVFTFKIHAHEATLIDESDTHLKKYDEIALKDAPFADFANPKEYTMGQDDDDSSKICVYSISAYPTQEMEDSFNTQDPLIYTVVVLCAFLSTVIFFMIFDYLVQRHQSKVMSKALKQNAIVSSLFPKSVQEKMMAEVEAKENKSNKKAAGKAGIKSYLNDDAANKDTNVPSNNQIDKSKPIADLFPETTIMFADLAGFTAWSSTREPSQVFTLLETIYHSFDTIAKRRRVFKVETIGDCYVAVCGLPDPNKKHALVMAKFCQDCLAKMSAMLAQLEVELGPGTSDLRLRAGLHSGPVVAGVLRGEKSRFQLFGDTMNTASRMESTGVPGRIQISSETADLLKAAKKENWCVPREDKITAKGKGELSTYWLVSGRGSGGSDAKSVLSCDMSVESNLTLDEFDMRGTAEAQEKIDRISDWTVDVLACLIKEIATRRVASRVKQEDCSVFETNSSEEIKKHNKHVIDEVKEIVELPEFEEATALKEQKMDPSMVVLSQDVFDELRDYVRTIAGMYNENPFHNFAHANHVTMSVTKLLSRIVAPDIADVNNKSLHDHTYGITSDPLTRFAVVLSALIHDVDHDGVSNMQLVKEKAEVAKMYKGKSVAEQNSVDIAWDLLMEPKYENLRRQIYQTEAEFKRFRQLVVNTVMATDIMDKDLKKLRNDRWDTAFQTDDVSSQLAKNRKATIVIEHLIQASDVAHTMQHWHIYRKWNELLFREMYKAYEEGRMEKDPSLDWYKGEIGFFDFYVIPLANKLKDCGVFGVSSDEYLSYAKQNRKEWEERGEEVVAEMVKNAKRKKVADHLFNIQQDLVDKLGEQQVDKMAKSIRRRSLQNAPAVIVTTGNNEEGSNSDRDKTNATTTESEDYSSVSEEDIDMPLND